MKNLLKLGGVLMLMTMLPWKAADAIDKPPVPQNLRTLASKAPSTKHTTAIKVDQFGYPPDAKEDRGHCRSTSGLQCQ